MFECLQNNSNHLQEPSGDGSLTGTIQRPQLFRTSWAADQYMNEMTDVFFHALKKGTLKYLSLLIIYINVKFKLEVHIRSTKEHSPEWCYGTSVSLSNTVS